MDQIYLTLPSNVSEICRRKTIKTLPTELARNLNC